MLLHMMLGLRAKGADVLEYRTDEHRSALDTGGLTYDRGTSGRVWLRWDEMAPVMDEYRPQLVVCNAGGLSFRPEDARRLRRRASLAGIALSEPDVFEPATRRISPHFDLFLTNAPACVARHQALGARARGLPIGTNEESYRPVPRRAAHTSTGSSRCGRWCASSTPTSTARDGRSMAFTAGGRSTARMC
jgi:hypothetical protein